METNKKYKFIKEVPCEAPEIKETVLYLPDKKGRDISSGMFRTILEKGAFIKRKPIVSAVINIPIFELTVNFNPQNKPPRCPVFLGTPTEDRPRDKKVFLLPEDAIYDTGNQIVFDVYWENWQIADVLINDGKPLVISNF